MREEVERALYHFIHPTVGGHDGTGWPFERALFLSDIYGLLQPMAGVEHLGVVNLVQVDASGAEHPVTSDQLALPQYALFCSAVHTVTVK